MNRALLIAIISWIGVCAPLPQMLLAAGRDSANASATVTPLGMELLVPRPHGTTFAIYASLARPLIRPLPARTEGASALPQSSGMPPSPAAVLRFRVTASTIGLASDVERPASFESNLGTDEVMKSLRFRLRLNRDSLESERVQPVEARLIGVPADVPYGERIYRVVFQVAGLQEHQRAVLEVLSAEGELLCKFPVTLN